MAVNGNQNHGITNGVTQARFRVTLTIEGNDWGVWDKRTGGGVSSGTTNYSPGGLASPVVLVGTKATEAIQVQRLYDLPRDHDNLQAVLDAVGGGKCVVKQLPIDKDGNAYSKRGAVVWNGLITNVAAPEHDSESTGPAMVVLTITPDGLPTVS